MATHTDACQGHPRPSLLARFPRVTGAAVGAATLLSHYFLTPTASLAFAAVVIGMIGGIYFGFAVVNGSPRHQAIEFGVAGTFAIAGMVGLLAWPLLLPAAYVAHAGWDLAHHNRARLALVAIPQWYVPWCAIIDVVAGAGLFLIFTTRGLI